MNERVDQEVVNRLEKIDPLEEAVKLKTHTDYNLLSYIATNEFFSIAFQAIKKVVDDIKEHYRSQLFGGSSSNQHIWELSTKFAQLETFLNENFIIYDNYSNFNRLFDTVLDGLFASYAISENQNDRLEYFDDYWVGKCILYGDEKLIRKLAYIYK